jgi:hypothetical protein
MSGKQKRGFGEILEKQDIRCWKKLREAVNSFAERSNFQAQKISFC